MPFATEPRERVHGTWPMCRVVVAARRLVPQHEWAVFRALQLAQFTSTLPLEEASALREAIAWLPGIDPDALIAAAGEPETEAAFERDRDEARTAAGSPTELMGRTANYDGRVRYTAPSVVVTAPDGRRLEAGGFQPIEAYDVIVANLDPTLTRRPAPEDPVEAVEAFPDGLVTAEVAAIMTSGNDAIDIEAAEETLIEPVAEGRIRRTTLGSSAFWQPASAPVMVLPSAAAVVRA
jgi:hypothetical protein